MRRVHRIFVIASIIAIAVLGTTAAAGAADGQDITVVGGPGVVSEGLAGHLAACTPGAVTRVAGSDRYQTAAELSRNFSTADTVFIATGANYPDAIAAGPIAALEGSPILLVRSDGVPAPTRAALTRLAPSTIVLLGGDGVIPASVESELASYAPTVLRIAGADRYQTAALLSAWYFDDPTTVDAVYLASGETFVDALVAGPVATRNGSPVLLSRSDSLPSSTADEIARLDPASVVIVGSTGSVSEAVAAELSGGGYDVSRIAGPSRWSTAVVAARSAPAGSPIMVATGDDFPDGLAAIPVANGAPILLVKAAELHDVTADAIGRATSSPCEGWVPPYPQVGSGKRVIYTLSGHQVWMIDEHDNLVDTYPVTGRKGIPLPGTYSVWSKSVKAYAPYGGITMRYMVRFVRPYTFGNRWSYGFHSIPRYSDGRPLQTVDELGSYGSGGCVRQEDGKAYAMYEWADIGTTVIVLP